MTIERNSELARAYRAARRYYGESGGLSAARRPASLAIAEARRRLVALEAIAAEYTAAQGDGADHTATPIPADNAAAVAARGKLTRARHRAGLYHGPDAWARVYPDTDSAFRDTVAAHDVTGAGIDHNGWYDNPHGESFRDGSGLCFGVVCQLPGRDGKARYVAGYQFGDCEGGPSLDLSTIYESPAESSWDTPDSMVEAARAADSMAESAAEKEREYKTAWGAGSAYADKLESEEAARAEALAILKERRAARATDPGAYPALCAAIRGKVESLVELIRESREERATLANGDSDPFYFWTGEERLRGAFCEGAGLDRFPA